MSSPIYRSTAAAIAFVGMTATIPTLAQAQDVSHTLGDNEAIFIDGKTLTVAPGRAKDDIGSQLGNLNVRPLGPGAIVFRAGDKLYVIEGAPMGNTYAMYDPGIDRQRSYGGLYDYPAYGTADRQRSYGGLNDDRQRSYGGLNDDRQRSYGGFYDSGAEWRRQQSSGGLYDPEYANYRLKKVFGSVWGTTSKN